MKRAEYLSELKEQLLIINNPYLEYLEQSQSEVEAYQNKEGHIDLLSSFKRNVNRIRFYKVEYRYGTIIITLIKHTLESTAHVVYPEELQKARIAAQLDPITWGNLTGFNGNKKILGMDFKQIVDNNDVYSAFKAHPHDNSEPLKVEFIDNTKPIIGDNKLRINNRDLSGKEIILMANNKKILMFDSKTERLFWEFNIMNKDTYIFITKFDSLIGERYSFDLINKKPLECDTITILSPIRFDKFRKADDLSKKHFLEYTLQMEISHFEEKTIYSDTTWCIIVHPKKFAEIKRAYKIQQERSL